MSKSLWITLLIRLMFGLVFLVYGIEKLIDYKLTIETITDSFDATFLPEVLVRMFVVILPFWEMIIGLMFLTGYRYRITLILTGILMTLLTVGVAVRGEGDHVARNMVYFFILLIGLWHSDNNRFALLNKANSLSNEKA